MEIQIFKFDKSPNGFGMLNKKEQGHVLNSSRLFNCLQSFERSLNPVFDMFNTLNFLKV